MVSEICSGSIRPFIGIDTQRYEIDDKALFAVIVPAGCALNDRPGSNVRRSGSTQRKLSSDDRMRLAQRRGRARFLWFDEQIVPGNGVRTLDDALWERFLSIEGANDPRTALTKLSLLVRIEANALRATVAEVLLCTRNREKWLPKVRITATKYRRRTRTTEKIDSHDMIGPLYRQIRESVNYCIRDISVASRKVSMRVETPQHRATALLESIFNAVDHRDYSMQGSKIRLSMFENRFELQS